MKIKLLSIVAVANAAFLPIVLNAAVIPNATSGEDFSGSGAVAMLKARGHLNSLQSAYSTARYQVHQSPNGTRVAENPAQGLKMDFTTAGPSVSSGGQDVRWQSALTLTGCGYGDNVTGFPLAEVSTSGNRLEYRRGILTEWYVNERAGLEQGFTLQTPPAGHVENAPLVISMAIGGNLTASVDDGEVVFSDAAGKRMLRYSGLVSWDANGRKLESHMRVRGSQLLLEVDDRSAVYPVTVDPVFSNGATLVASDATEGDQFGYSLSISGDVAVIGAPYDDGAGVDSGSAYVFVRDGDTWTQQQKLIAGDSAAGDQFASSVAISGDTLVVGAWGTDDAGGNSGSAYVFVHEGNSWIQKQKLTASDGSADDFFGESVAISDNTIVVGAVYDSAVAAQSGSAYVFVRNGASWTQQQKLTAFDGAEGDWFGYSVAIDGETIVVGVYSDDDAGAESGAAYVFVRAGTVWSTQQKLSASDAEADDWFGYSVAISGETVVIGAPFDQDTAVVDSGSAYVFTRDGGIWSEQQKLTAEYPSADDHFGFSVAVDGDTAVIGAPLKDLIFAGYRSGIAYVFARNGSGWSQQQQNVAGPGALGGMFGYAVAISGDTALAGAPYKYIADVGYSVGSVSAFNTQLDTVAPVISSATASPGNLGAPNHKMVPVTVDVTATDNFGGQVGYWIVSVSSNEPVGNGAPDWEIVDASTVNLRAERNAQGNGRVYTITVECQDETGNASFVNIEVKVSKGHK
ncbi:MAG: FG-GAP repeat protein [Luteolibacter sp.]|uniref:FG-GAP repeat protein n=1 Tax=Luteolibacter sp. TaxID=1962973 RepID=UPI003267840D